MCGIYGEFHTGKNRNVPESLFQSLNDLNFHRGPDSGGHFAFEDRVQLGFRRLAILDLSTAANQPMVMPNGKWAMVFNGEVYNHKEIKNKLPEGKYTFKTTSDTEVILYAMDHFGPMEAVKMLDGMFAIGLVNLESLDLYLFRDFAGIKPLFYGLKEGSIVFGSQYDQITKHPLFQHESINPEVLSVYLQWHYVPAPLGMMQHTGQLLPGEWLRMSGRGEVHRGIYWEFNPFVDTEISSETEALDYLESLLLDSVRAELESDVPLGAFLSGGIDSPLIVSLAQQLQSNPIQTFSIGSDSAVHDESIDAQWYANKIGANQHLTKMNSAFALKLLPEVMKSLKEPFADFSIIPTYLVSKLAREKVTVALSGDGGDELFYGYERFFSLGKNFPYIHQSSVRKKITYALHAKLLKNGKVNSGILATDLGRYHAGLHSRFKSNSIQHIWSGFSDTFPEIPFHFSMHWNPTTEEDLIKQIAKAEFYGMMQKTLMKVDRASMGVSLEVRVPFLLKSNIEKSMAISPWLSYGQGKKKELLKKLLRKRLPGAPIDQKKRGFTVPLSQWIREDLNQEFKSVLLDSSFSEQFGFNRAGIEQLIQSHQQGQDQKWPLFTLYSLSHWNNNR
jgi:asparagine synthase (glutamine-hydrolysing)